MDSSARARPFSQYFSPPPKSFRFYDEPALELGRGAYGSVYPGELAGRPVAVKRIHSLLLEAHGTGGDYVVRSFEQECRRMESLNHSHVVGFLGAYQDAKGPFLVMERMAQNLRRFLAENRGKLRLQRQLQLCLDIVTGLQYLHTQETPLIHRDLNDKNILLDEDGKASIADLGQSKLKNRPDQYFDSQAPGAMVFMPPEALSRNPHYNEKVDIFSFGVLMLEIATQQGPQAGLEGIATVDEAERRKEDLDCLPEGHPLKQLILDCLKNKPCDRPCISDLYDVLQQLAKPAELFRLAKDSLQSAVTQLEASVSTATALANIAHSDESELLAAVSTRIARAKLVVERSEMKVVFFGRTSNGKSTLINALLKHEVLPTGFGSVTSCFCLIKGQSKSTEGGYIKLKDSDEEFPVEDASELASYFEENALTPASNLEISWSTAQCPMLSGDIVLVDCPGLNAEEDMDTKVIEHCTDADVFVYVGNGTSTFETGERALLDRVAQKVSSPSNTFILFNHWDTVENRKGADKVKQQHLKKVDEILVKQLQVYTAEMAQKRTFFVSAEEAFTACDVQHQTALNEQSRVLRRQQEFERFQRMMQKCLIEATVATKFGRHYDTSVRTIDEMKNALDRMAAKWKNEQEILEGEVESKASLLAEINVAEQTLQQITKETVQSAVEEFGVLFDEFHDRMKEDLRGKVEVYPDKSEEEKWADYQRGIIEHLDETMQDLMKPFEQQLKTFAIDTIKPLQETYAQWTINIDKLQAQDERDSSSLVHPTCTDMTKGYRARPWFGREVLNMTVSFWKDVVKDEPTTSADLYETEVITVDGEEHEVRKRDHHSLKSEFMAASFWIGANTIVAPLGALSLSLLGLAWAFDIDELHKEQVKDKIIKRLRKQLDARKETVKSQYLDRLQSQLQSLVKCFDAAVTDRKKVLKKHIEDLQQRIAAHRTWIVKATHHQDQLQQEVKPCLDRFYSMYLQGESA